MKVFCTRAMINLRDKEVIAVLFAVPYLEEKPLADYYSEGLARALEHIDTYYKQDSFGVNYDHIFTDVKE